MLLSNATLWALLAAILTLCYTIYLVIRCTSSIPIARTGQRESSPPPSVALSPGVTASHSPPIDPPVETEREERVAEQ